MLRPLSSVIFLKSFTIWILLSEVCSFDMSIATSSQDMTILLLVV